MYEQRPARQEVFIPLLYQLTWDDPSGKAKVRAREEVRKVEVKLLQALLAKDEVEVVLVLREDAVKAVANAQQPQ